MPFKKGTSGNPIGRPANFYVAKYLDKEIEYDYILEN